MKTKLFPKNMISYVKLCICAFTLCVLGCAQLEKKEENSTISMKNKLNELSRTISYMVNDGNNLHNEMNAIRSGNRLLHYRIDELESLLKNINQRLNELKIEDEKEVNLTPAQEKPETTLPPSDAVSEKKEKEGTAPQKHDLITGGKPRAVAEGFWNAFHAKDLEKAKTYVTKASQKSLTINNDGSSGNEGILNQLTFGSTEIKNGKAIVPTTMITLHKESKVEIPLKTVLIKEDGNWKVDAEETMMSIFGGAMGQIMEGLGEAMQEGMKEMGKAMAEGLKQGMEEMSNTDAKEKTKNNEPKSDTESFASREQQ